MKVLRTPDECFTELPDFGFPVTYTEIDAGVGDGTTLRIAHVEAGPSDGPVVLCMHGEPSWSFLYRHVMAALADAGIRAIAPDLVGFGRSDKPADRADYTYARHVDWMQAWFDAVGIDHATLLCQDWGGLIGLRLVAANPERFDRVVVANTFLPTGDRHPGDAFMAWQKFSQEVETFPVGFIINGGCTTDLTPDVIAAYDAPFPDETFKEGARQFPTLVPTTPDNPESDANRAAWKVLATWDKPFLCAFSDKDPITGGADRLFHTQVPGCAGQDHVTIEGGGHFLQEDCGPALAQAVIDLIRADTA